METKIDVILGQDWLRCNQGMIQPIERTVSLTTPSGEVISYEVPTWSATNDRISMQYDTTMVERLVATDMSDGVQPKSSAHNDTMSCAKDSM